MESSLHGEVSIVMQSEKENEYWSVREFVLTHEKKERVVIQFQFTGWPDHGVPDNPGPVIEFVRTVRGQEDPENNRGPMVVHCRYNMLNVILYTQAFHRKITKLNIMQPINVDT